MKNIMYTDDYLRRIQVIKIKMSLKEKIKFLFTGKLEIPYELLRR